LHQLSLFDYKPPPSSPAPVAPPRKLARIAGVSEADYIPHILRGYQRDAVEAVGMAYEDGYRAPLIALATSGGKTTILSEFLVQFFLPSQHRALVIAHTEEIIFQLEDRIRNQFSGALDVEFDGSPGVGVVMGVMDAPDARVVVATRQSCHANRLPRLLAHGAFDFLIIDEAHHAVSNNTYGAIVDTLREANPDLQILGVTATPKRTDRKALGGIFDTICYSWLITDGIQSGYLAPPVRVEVSTRVDVQKVGISRGDYNQKKLVSLLETSNWLELSLDAYAQYILPENRPTLAFLPSVAMSIQFAQALQSQYGVMSAHIDGTTPKDERRDILRRYKANEIVCVANFGVLTEGFDAPHTGAIFLARPTRSSTLFTQIVGRGLRLFPGKEYCLLVDLTVRDTKALEVGTLLGVMEECTGCGAQFFAGLSHCPHCGLEVPEPEPTEEEQEAERRRQLREKYLGEGLVTAPRTMFADSMGAWYIEPDGYCSCSLGDAGSVVIAPPTEDDHYRLLHIPRSQYDEVVVLARGDDFAALVIDADAYIDKVADAEARKLVDGGAFWREQPASTAQKDLLSRKLGGHSYLDWMTKGEAAQLITHRFAMGRLRQMARKG